MEDKLVKKFDDELNRLRLGGQDLLDLLDFCFDKNVLRCATAQNKTPLTAPQTSSDGPPRRDRLNWYPQRSPSCRKIGLVHVPC